MTERGYGSPDAFRRALTDRLRTRAQESRWDLAQLQRQIAYDRLLERLYFVDDGWIVKGAAALLARDIGVRASIDIDVYRAKALEIAKAELREAAARDIGDWFRFELGPSQPAGDGSPAIRLPVVGYVGQAEWARFHVDLVGSDIVMTGTPEDVPPLARVAIPDVEQHGYRAYPLVDHIADKIASMFQRYGRDQHPSTRYRDLSTSSRSLAARPSRLRRRQSHCAQRSSADRSRCRTDSRCLTEPPGRQAMPARQSDRCSRTRRPSTKRSQSFGRSSIHSSERARAASGTGPPAGGLLRVMKTTNERPESARL